MAAKPKTLINLIIDGINRKKSIKSEYEAGIIPLKSMNRREIEIRKTKEINMIYKNILILILKNGMEKKANMLTPIS